MIWQNTHTQTLYLHTRFHFLLFFPPREEFNFLIEVFYFVRRKLCFALFCLVFVFISAASPSNVSTVFVLAHTRWHNEQTQHPSASFSLLFFFFHGPNFLPSAEREQADGAANLAVGPGRSVRDPVRYWAAMRRGGGAAGGVVFGSSCAMGCAQVCRLVLEIGCKKVLMWIHKHLSQGCYMQKHETISQGSCQALLEHVWSKVFPWRHMCHAEQRE